MNNKSQAYGTPNQTEEKPMYGSVMEIAGAESIPELGNGPRISRSIPPDDQTHSWLQK